MEKAYSLFLAQCATLDVKSTLGKARAPSSAEAVVKADRWRLKTDMAAAFGAKCRGLITLTPTQRPKLKWPAKNSANQAWTAIKDVAPITLPS